MSGYPQQSMGVHHSQVAANYGTSSRQMGPVGMNIRGGGIMGQLPRNMLGNPNHQHMASYYPRARSPMTVRPRMPVNPRPLNIQQHPGMRPTLPPRPLMRGHAYPSIKPIGYQGQAQEGYSMPPKHQSSFRFSAPPIYAGHGHMGSPVTSRAPQFVGGATRPLPPPSWTTSQATPPAQQLTPPAHRLTPKTLGWNAAKTPDGLTCYVNRRTPLPEGWEASKTSDGLTYYLDHINRRTQWERPTVHKNSVKIDVQLSCTSSSLFSLLIGESSHGQNSITRRLGGQ